jgi:hypothetical protein
MTAIQRQHDEVIVRLSDTAERAHLWWWRRLLNRLHWMLNWAGCRFSGTLTEPSIQRRLTSDKTTPLPVPERAAALTKQPARVRRFITPGPTEDRFINGQVWHQKRIAKLPDQAQKAIN